MEDETLFDPAGHFTGKSVDDLVAMGGYNTGSAFIEDYAIKNMNYYAWKHVSNHFGMPTETGVLRNRVTGEVHYPLASMKHHDRTVFMYEGDMLCAVDPMEVEVLVWKR